MSDAYVAQVEREARRVFDAIAARHRPGVKHRLVDRTAGPFGRDVVRAVERLLAGEAELYPDPH